MSSLWEAASAGRGEGGWPGCSAALRVPGAEAVPQSGAAGFQRCLGTCSRPCLQAEPFQSKIANSSERLALLSRHRLLCMIKHFSPSAVHFVGHTHLSHTPLS